MRLRSSRAMSRWISPTSSRIHRLREWLWRGFKLLRAQAPTASRAVAGSTGLLQEVEFGSCGPIFQRGNSVFPLALFACLLCIGFCNEFSEFNGRPGRAGHWALGDLLGRRVAISGDAGPPSVPAYSYNMLGGSWTHVDKLRVSGAGLCYFRCAVAISGDAGSNNGAAYILHVLGCVWTQVTKLLATGAAATDYIGFALASYNHAGSNSGSACIFNVLGGNVGGCVCNAGYLVMLPSRAGRTSLVQKARPVATSVAGAHTRP